MHACISINFSCNLKDKTEVRGSLDGATVRSGLLFDVWVYVYI